MTRADLDRAKPRQRYFVRRPATLRLSLKHAGPRVIVMDTFNAISLLPARAARSSRAAEKRRLFEMRVIILSSF